jgi:hypothetical protein
MRLVKMGRVYRAGGCYKDIAACWGATQSYFAGLGVEIATNSSFWAKRFPRETREEFSWDSHQPSRRPLICQKRAGLGHQQTIKRFVQKRSEIVTIEC